jgi:alpha-N-arabinofuranosidase
LGRETFLAKVIWEDGWPIVNPGVGKLEDIVELPFDGDRPKPRDIQSLSDLSKDKYDVVYLRNPKVQFYKNMNRTIRINYLPETLKELESPAYLGFRQLEYEYEAVLSMEFDQLSDTEEAGLVLLQSNEYHMLFRIKKNQADGKTALQVIKCLKKEDNVLAEKFFTAAELMTDKNSNTKSIRIKVKGHGQKADFILLSGENEVPMLLNEDIHEMSTDVAGGFVGNTIGVYASSNGVQSDNYVDIADFTIRY